MMTLGRGFRSFLQLGQKEKRSWAIVERKNLLLLLLSPGNF